MDEYQMNGFLIKMQVDDTITDITPPTHGSYSRDYTKKFYRNTIKEKRSKFMTDHRSYTHSLSSYEIKA